MCRGRRFISFGLDLAKDGLPSGDQGGYSLFDNEKIGISPFVQNVNLKRALQDELAKSIQMIDGVMYARVHIVSGDQTLFNSSQQQTSASVVLKLKAGLSAQQHEHRSDSQPGSRAASKG